MDSGLIVEYIDERYEATADDVVTFGRSATIVIDDNPYMHRIVGSFVHHQRGWWLRNDARSIEFAIMNDDGRRSRVPPGAAEPLSGSGGTVRFRAGAAGYELAFILAEPLLPPPRGPELDGQRITRPFGVIRLNEDQRLLLAALAEPWMLRPAVDSPSVPANAEVAHRLGWSVRKLDRKLDYLCGRLSRLGVPGLRGVKGEEATDRRLRLVEHVLTTSMIDERDLVALRRHENERTLTPPPSP